MRRLMILLSLIALGFAWAIPAARGAGSYDFTTFDVPFTAPFSGAVNTLPLGINNLGQVVGGYVNSTFSIVHGFLRNPNGDFAKIDPFQSSFQRPRTLNDFGVIVGRYRTFDGRHGDHCYVIQAGSVTTFDVPFSNGFGTRCNGINDLGQIVGTYFAQDNHFHGFLLNLSDGSFSQIADLSIDTLAFKINNEGQIVGNYMAADGLSHGFLLSQGTFSPIDFPGAIETDLGGINNNGQIVGDYVDTDNHFHGFLFANGSYTTVALPGVIQNANGSTIFNLNFNVAIEGINDNGVITGVFLGADGNFHGFVGVPQNRQ